VVNAKRFPSNVGKSAVGLFHIAAFPQLFARHGYPFSTQFYVFIIERLNAPGEAHIVLTRGM
jgi:hypothetical protein